MRAVYSYLYLDLQLDKSSRDTITETYEDSNPDHQLSLRSLTDAEPWSISATGRWVAAMDRLELDAYLTLDARVARTFADGLELSLTGRNLLQSQHQEAQSVTVGAAPTAVQREAYLALTWRH